MRGPHLNSSKGSCPPFIFDAPGDNNPTAEQMAQQMAGTLGGTDEVRLQARTGLPVIWAEFYPVAVDVVNCGRTGALFSVGTAPRDNQELVDFFEAQMRTVGQVAAGYFMFAANLANNSNGSFLDPLKQPALVNAMANWWGGDTAFFAPCLGLPAPPSARSPRAPSRPCALSPSSSWISRSQRASPPVPTSGPPSSSPKTSAGSAPSRPPRSRSRPTEPQRGLPSQTEESCDADAQHERSLGVVGPGPAREALEQGTFMARDAHRGCRPLAPPCATLGTYHGSPMIMT